MEKSGKHMLMIWIWKMRRNVGIMVIWESFNYLLIECDCIILYCYGDYLGFFSNMGIILITKELYVPL